MKTYQVHSLLGTIDWGGYPFPEQFQGFSLSRQMVGSVIAINPFRLSMVAFRKSGEICTSMRPLTEILRISSKNFQINVKSQCFYRKSYKSLCLFNLNFLKCYITAILSIITACIWNTLSVQF